MRFFLLLLLLLLLSACKKKNETSPSSDSSPIIVEVGGNCLTEKMLKEALPEPHSKKDALLYARDWLDLELLAIAAKEAQLDKEEQYQRTIREIERNLLAMTYLNNQLALGVVEPTEDQLREYYAKNTELFTRADKAIQFDLLVYNKPKNIWAIRNKLTSKNFRKEVTEGDADSTFISEKPLSLRQFSDDLGEYLFSIREGGISKPMKVDDKMHIYLIRRKYLPGTPLSFTEARESVLQRVRSDLKRGAEKRVKEKLRKKSNYIHNEEFFKETPRSKTDNSIQIKTGDINA